jgi:hypothetical protein
MCPCCDLVLGTVPHEKTTVFVCVIMFSEKRVYLGFTLRKTLYYIVSAKMYLSCNLLIHGTSQPQYELELRPKVYHIYYSSVRRK